MAHGSSGRGYPCETIAKWRKRSQAVSFIKNFDSWKCLWTFDETDKNDKNDCFNNCFKLYVFVKLIEIAYLLTLWRGRYWVRHKITVIACWWRLLRTSKCGSSKFARSKPSTTHSTCSTSTWRRSVSSASAGARSMTLRRSRWLCVVERSVNLLSTRRF